MCMDIKAIIEAGGGPTKVGLATGLSHSTICCWTRVPAKHVKVVARVTGLARHVLRPDLYDDPDEVVQ